MKKYLLIVIIVLINAGNNTINAQKSATIEGKCDNDIGWSFDGYTLNIFRTNLQKFDVSIPNYDVNNKPSPWVKRNLPVKKVCIGFGIIRIGSCAFAGCKSLEAVEFSDGNNFREIGWGAFLYCSNLFNFSIPYGVRKIEKSAFAGCSSLRSVSIPEQARVEDYAFLSCSNLNVLDIAVNALLGKAVFACEQKNGDHVSHTYYQGEIRSLPANINASNSHVYGIAKEAVEEFFKKQRPDLADEEETTTSDVDMFIPSSEFTRNDTYALIIGNQHYRFAPDVPYARHDAQIFAQYCKKTLGIPSEHIHLCKDATKAMIIEQEIEDWLGKEIQDKHEKKVIIYYAGHGVPDIENQNKSYILPTDVLGTTPKRGISLEAFYATIGRLGFQQVTIFMDACFSGVSRNNESVNMGERATEVDAPDTNISMGNMVVFCAAQGNETAQGFLKEGHGLFTYYLLKELQQSKGQVTYGKLSKELQKNVSQTAPTLELRKKQTPSTTVSNQLSSSWSKTML